MSGSICLCKKVGEALAIPGSLCYDGYVNRFARFKGVIICTAYNRTIDSEMKTWAVNAFLSAAGIESNVSLLVEQAMDQMMEQEQFSIGWEEE